MTNLYVCLVSFHLRFASYSPPLPLFVYLAHVESNFVVLCVNEISLGTSSSKYSSRVNARFKLCLFLRVSLHGFEVPVVNVQGYIVFYVIGHPSFPGTIRKLSFKNQLGLHYQVCHFLECFASHAGYSNVLLQERVIVFPVSLVSDGSFVVNGLCSCWRICDRGQILFRHYSLCLEHHLFQLIVTIHLHQLPRPLSVNAYHRCVREPTVLLLKGQYPILSVKSILCLT